MPKLSKNNLTLAAMDYMGPTIFPVERFMIDRNYAPICNSDSSVKAWQRTGDHKAVKISVEEAARMMQLYNEARHKEWRRQANRTMEDWE